jgi:inner membrane protein
MDSITQIVLGASVGEAVCGKRAGNKALVWGAVAGTIPDLDVLATPFMDMVDQLDFHRGVTHSILFALVVSPLLGGLVKRIHRHDPATFRDWTLVFFLGFVTHALLDCCTTWGTKLFYPFSDRAISFQNVFVIDPLYTVPFLICVIAVFFYHRTDKRRRFWNYAGLTISTAYLLVSGLNKFAVNRVFEANLDRQNISYTRYSTRPTPLNTLLWSVTAEVPEGYYIGYYSLLDPDKDVHFRYFPKNHDLLGPWQEHAKLQQLLNITEGYYTVHAASDSLLISDLRFGQLDGWGEANEPFTFTYIVRNQGGNLHFSQLPNDAQKARKLMPDLLRRIAGRETEGNRTFNRAVQ